jgi:tripartite ATP-independent transporter DctM subunit
VTGTSLGALFLAGLVPGLILGGIFMIVVGILAYKRGWSRYSRFSLEALWYSGLRSILAFGMPGIIVGGLVFGAFTPSEAGAFGVMYAIFLSCIVYRSLRFRDLYRVFGAAVQLTGELLIIVSLSFALGSSLSAAHIPALLGSYIDVLTIGDSEYMRLMALMFLAIVAGMFLDPLIPVLVPVILPTLLAFDIDLIQFGALMTMAVVIGQLTPPVAIALIITSRIAEVDMMKIFWANVPFFVAIIILTLLMMGVPEIATWLPTYAGY